MSEKDNNKVPNWKSDFPIEQEKFVNVSRREFAKFLTLFSASLALGSGMIALKPLIFPKKKIKKEHFVCDVSDVSIGEMRVFKIEENNNTPYILIHLSESSWRAFEQKCTHLSCSVRYRHDIKKIECPCHKGFFDAKSGEVLQGPPPRPLPQLTVIVRDEKVYVTEYKKY